MNESKEEDKSGRKARRRSSFTTPADGFVRFIFWRNYDVLYRKIGCFLSCLVVFITGCATTGRLVTAETAIQDYSINAPIQNVFEAALVVAQFRNLDVSVLEKQSGLIRFEAASLSPTQLDKYCEYPYVHPNTGRAWDTFVNWNKRSLNAGGGPVRGKVSLTLLITGKGSASNINLRSNWTSYNSIETTLCNSNGEFEREFINDLKRHL